MPGPNPTPAEEQLIAQLTRVADSLHRIADELDNVNQHSAAGEVIDQLRFIAQRAH